MAIERIGGTGPWPEAIRASNFLFVSGQTAVAVSADDVPPVPGSQLTKSIEGETAAQIWTAYRQVEASA